MAHCRARKAEVLLANFAQVWVKSSNVCSLGRECVLYWHPPALEIAQEGGGAAETPPSPEGQEGEELGEIVNQS